MAEILCASPLVRGTEFFLDDQGVRLFGTCGERALASAASSVLGRNVNPLDIYDSMRNHGWADPGGASTIGRLLDQARLMNLPIAAVQMYGEPWGNWYAWCKSQVLVGNPTVVESANGQALVDTISGQGENAQNLQYHYWVLLGYFSGGFSQRAQRNLPEGFWCADGDSFAGNNDNAHGFNAVNVLQFYSIDVLAAARLCAALAIQGKAIKMAWTELPDGTGKDDQGHTCGRGHLAFLKGDNLMTTDGLMSETYFTSTESFLPMTDGQILVWDGHEIVINQDAQTLVTVWGQLEAVQKEIAALKLAASTPVVPVSAPAPAPLSTSDQLAIEALAAIKAALAAN